MTAPAVREAIGKALNDVVKELIESSGVPSTLDAAIRRQPEGSPVNDHSPTQRGLVLVDGADGIVLEHFVEDNSEDWTDIWEAATAAATRVEPRTGGYKVSVQLLM